MENKNPKHQQLQNTNLCKDIHKSKTKDKCVITSVKDEHLKLWKDIIMTMNVTTYHASKSSSPGIFLAV